MAKNIKACPHCYAKRCRRGFSILELMLAVGLFSIFSFAIIVAILQSSSATQAGIRAEVARQWALEGMEAVRAIRDQSFDDLSDTNGTGVRFENGKWEFSGTEDEWEGYQRVIAIQPARRDGDGNIVSADGAEDADLKMISATVTKDNFSIEFSAYLSRREIITVP